MSSVFMHAAVAIPFVLAGEWAGAMACVAADIVWVPHEIAFRRSGCQHWDAWVMRPGSLHPDVVHAYRLVHSWALGGLVLGTLIVLNMPHAVSITMGHGAHLLLDLFTHRGVMAQRPLYPFSQWRWKWTIQR